jgi:hypothetical protein
VTPRRIDRARVETVDPYSAGDHFYPKLRAND